MGTWRALWPTNAAAVGLAASFYIDIDLDSCYRQDYGDGIPKQERSDHGSIYWVGRNRPRPICVRPTMRRVQARMWRQRIGHLSASLPGMSGLQARVGLLSLRGVHSLEPNSQAAGRLHQFRSILLRRVRDIAPFRSKYPDLEFSLEGWIRLDCSSI
jgi:hypothetical protein